MAFRILVLVLGILCGVPSILLSQQVTLSAPMHSLGDSFYENFGVNLGLAYNSPSSQFFFNQGGGVPPAFGGFDPNAQSTLGVRGRRGNWSWNLGLSAGQGSNRSSVTTTPMLTLPNGGFGMLNNTTTRPFVTGIIPVVNQQVIQRQRFRAQFATAAEIVKQRRKREAERDSLEMAELKRKSDASTRPTKRLDAPLVLGKTPTADKSKR